MKIMFSILSTFAAGAAHAHDSLAPHQHPHATSILPDIATFGVAALVLALGIVAYIRFKRG